MLIRIRKISLIFIMLILTLMEIKAFTLTIKSQGAGIFVYYTEISNLISLLSFLAVLVFVLLKFKDKSLKIPSWLSAVRFLSTTMLLMTMLITIFVLVPYSPHLKDELLFTGYGLYHHTLVPIISGLSFVFLEPHFSKFKVVFVPLIVTFVYGMVMILLNYLGKVSGPYFFLKVHNQAVSTTVIWCIALLLLVFIFASIIYLLGFGFDFIKRKLTKLNT